MKVILLKDIAKVGKKYEVKNVPDGHAVNFLIPRKLVEAATSQNLKNLEKRQSKMSADREMAEDQFKQLLSQLGDAKVSLAVEANDQGHLFKGLHEKDIAGALTDAAGTTVDTDSVVLSQPIKKTGEHAVRLQFGDLKGEVSVLVETKK